MITFNCIGHKSTRPAQFAGSASGPKVAIADSIDDVVILPELRNRYDRQDEAEKRLKGIVVTGFVRQLEQCRVLFTLAQRALQIPGQITIIPLVRIIKSKCYFDYTISYHHPRRFETDVLNVQELSPEEHSPQYEIPTREGESVPTLDREWLRQDFIKRCLGWILGLYTVQDDDAEAVPEDNPRIS
jgi:hypothetical protein